MLNHKAFNFTIIEFAFSEREWSRTICLHIYYFCSIVNFSSHCCQSPLRITTRFSVDCSQTPYQVSQIVKCTRTERTAREMEGSAYRFEQQSLR